LTRIFYIAPDNDKPSWGLGIIYHHVAALVKVGLNATIVKNGETKVPSWLNVETPIISYSKFWSSHSNEDYLVVPEVMVNFENLALVKCKKILFVQAGAFIFESMPRGTTHRELGFTEAIVIMPHLESIVQKYLELPTVLIPPFIADYFFLTKPRKKKKQILIYPKFQQIDYSIIKYLITNYLSQVNKKNPLGSLLGKHWKLVELIGMSHKQVASAMKKSEIFVSLNSFEALNTSVVEAMASKTHVFCYEGFGPRDYLVADENAFVVSNNEPYLLFDKIVDFVNDFENASENYATIRENAFEVARRYKYENMLSKLIQFYDKK
jgi:hypothetical protein